MKTREEIEQRIEDIEKNVNQFNEFCNTYKLPVPESQLKSMYGLGQQVAALNWVLKDSENELGDSGVTGEHGELHDVSLSHTHGEGGKKPVERPLPSRTDEKEVCTCEVSHAVSLDVNDELFCAECGLHKLVSS